MLFTDIEGSTRLLEELGDGYPAALAEHRRVLREVFARHGGVEVDTQGDAFFIAFIPSAIVSNGVVFTDLQAPPAATAIPNAAAPMSSGI